MVSCPPRCRSTGLPGETTQDISQSHLIIPPDHAASRKEGSFADLLVGDGSATSRSSPKIRAISVATSAPKAVTRLIMNSTVPTLTTQLWRSHAENMTTPFEEWRTVT